MPPEPHLQNPETTAARGAVASDTRRGASAIPATKIEWTVSVGRSPDSMRASAQAVRRRPLSKLPAEVGEALDDGGETIKAGDVGRLWREDVCKGGEGPFAMKKEGSSTNSNMTGPEGADERAAGAEASGRDPIPREAGADRVEAVATAREKILEEEVARLKLALEKSRRTALELEERLVEAAFSPQHEPAPYSRHSASPLRRTGTAGAAGAGSSPDLATPGTGQVGWVRGYARASNASEHELREGSRTMPGGVGDGQWPPAPQTNVPLTVPSTTCLSEPSAHPRCSP